MTEFKSLAEFAAYAKERAQLVDKATQDYLRMTESPDGDTPADVEVWEREYLHPNPNEDDCRFCRAMATCPAMARKVEETLGASFQVIQESGVSPVVKLTATRKAIGDVDGGEVHLSRLMTIAGMIEDWIKAVRAEVERRLLQGQSVPGWGLELGRQGPRQWIDDEKAEEVLRTKFRLTVEQSYDLKVISPTTAEKLTKTLNKKGLKMLINKRQWEAMQALIVRRPSVPSVKPTKEIKTPYVPGGTPIPDAFQTIDEESLS